MVKNNQKGFTLLELAIVLVIIGVILGAVLKGQDLINNAKAKRLLNDTKGLATLQYAFYDRYGRFAGDCDNDGSIDPGVLSDLVPSSFKATPATFGFCYDPNNIQYGDADSPWNELGQAQLVTFTNAREVARNPFGGALYTGSAEDPNAKGVHYNAVVATNVPCYAAKMVDQAIDGSLNANGGSVRILNGSAYGTANNPATWDCNSEQQLVSYVYFFDRVPGNN